MLNLRSLLDVFLLLLFFVWLIKNVFSVVNGCVFFLFSFSTSLKYVEIGNLSSSEPLSLREVGGLDVIVEVPIVF